MLGEIGMVIVGHMSSKGTFGAKNTGQKFLTPKNCWSCRNVCPDPCPGAIFGAGAGHASLLSGGWAAAARLILTNGHLTCSRVVWLRSDCGPTMVVRLIGLDYIRAPCGFFCHKTGHPLTDAYFECKAEFDIILSTHWWAPFSSG